MLWQQFNVIRPLCDFIEPSHDPQALVNLMSGFACLLVVAEDQGKFDELKREIEECGGLQKIKNLKNHTDEELENKAIYLVDFYFTSSEV